MVRVSIFALIVLSCSVGQGVVCFNSTKQMRNTAPMIMSFLVEQESFYSVLVVNYTVTLKNE